MEEALEIQRDCSGCDEEAADTLSNMGLLYAKSEDYAEAVAVLHHFLYCKLCAYNFLGTTTCLAR